MKGVFMADSVFDRSAKLTESPTEQENCTLPVYSATVGRRLPSEELCYSVKQLKTSGEEENEDHLFLVGCDAEYISEGEMMRESSNINLEEKIITDNLDRPMKQLKRVIKDLQKSLDVSEDCNSAIIAENTALKNQIKILKQLIEDDRHFRDELDALRVAKLEKEQICNTLEASNKQLEKKYETLKDQTETVASELSGVQAEKERFKKKSEEHSQVVIALQQELMEHTLRNALLEELVQQKSMSIRELEDIISNYRTIKQDMKEKIQDLEDQLALALVKESGCAFMHFDNTQPAGLHHSMSLGEELGLLFVDQMEYTNETEQNEDEDDDEYETMKKETWWSHIARWLKKGAHAAGVFCISFLALLFLLQALAPARFDWLGLGSVDFMWIMARLIRRYFSFHYIGPPPV